MKTNKFGELKKLIAIGKVNKAIMMMLNDHEFAEFSDVLIMRSAKLKELEKANLLNPLEPELLFHMKDKILQTVLAILSHVEISSDDEVELGFDNDEYEKLNRTRWEEQSTEGETKKLLHEILEKENQKNKVKSLAYKKEIEDDVSFISKLVAKEFERLKNLFSDSDFSANLPDTTFVGIDFGTSNTVVSYLCYFKNRNEFKITSPETIELPFYKPKEAEEFIIPSKIFYDDESNKLLFGIDAKRTKQAKHVFGENYWASFKTQLGNNAGNIYFNSLLKEGHPLGKILEPDDAAKIFFSWLLDQVQQYVVDKSLPENICYTVSIPASFNSNKRRAYLNILEALGLNTNKAILIDEPNAAFLNCLVTLPREKVKALQRKHILVFDFGAGTCDISIVEFWQNDNGVINSKLFSTSSDNALGGDNIDYKIAKNILFDRFKEKADLQDQYFTPEQIESIAGNLKDVAEQLKIAACRRINNNSAYRGSENIVVSNDTTIVDYKGRKMHLDEFDMIFSEFDKIMEEFINVKDLPSYSNHPNKKSIFVPVKSALEKASMIAKDIDYVLLIGGSCKNPYIKSALNDHFKEAEILTPDALQTHVSKGTALNTAMIYGVGRNIMNPIISETLSLMLSDGTLFPLIKAGATVPHDEIHIEGFKTTKLDQSEIDIPIFLGGSKKVLSCFRISGNFSNEDSFDLSIRIDENKKIDMDVYVLRPHALTTEKVKSVQFMPFSSEILSPYRREVKTLERKLYQFLSEGYLLSNFKVISLVKKIANLHAVHNNFKEALNVCINYHPKNYTLLSFYASNAGEKEMSYQYRKLAYEKDKDAISAFNYAHVFDHNSKEFEKLMEEAALKGHISAKHTHGLILKKRGLEEKGEKFIKEAYKVSLANFKREKESLKSWQYQGLKKLAHYFNDMKLVREIERIEDQLELERQKLRKEFIIANCFAKPD